MLFFLYTGLRILSFSTFTTPLLQGIIVFIVLMSLGVLFFKKPAWALSLVLFELFLGGSGHLFEIGGIAIRSAILLVFLLLYSIKAIAGKNTWRQLSIPHGLFYVTIIMCIYMVYASINGIRQGNAIIAAIQDLTPFLFFGLLPPIFHLTKEKKGQEFFLRLCVVSTISAAIFAVYNEILFASGHAIVHDHYYSWFRDVLMGKITDMHTGFFRIVLPEHLLAIPGLLIPISLILKKEKHHFLWYSIIFANSITLTLNLSRAYILGILIGFIPLLYRRNFLRYFVTIVTVVAVMALNFFTLHFIASGGKSFGQNLFFNRAASIVQPKTEKSTYTRTSLLDPILRKIRQSPIFGSGLGSTITFQPPNSSKMVTTRQFDWGYLEIITELGVIGLCIVLLFFAQLIIALKKSLDHMSDFPGLAVGILATLIALLFIQIFAPIFTHVLGIFFLVLCSVFVTQKHTPFERIIAHLYRLFHRKA